MDVKIAGCVILYNPDNAVVDNIKTYVRYLNKLYIIDNQNGDKVIHTLKNQFSNIEIIKHTENLGIAYSLNEVLKICKGKYTHLLTMDQDSYFIDRSMENYLHELKIFNWDEVLGIGPKIVTESTPQKIETIVTWKKTNRLITSGNIISVNNAIKAGGFEEKLFIDEVDYDFCYKGLLLDLKLFICSDGIYLKHSLGNMITRHFMYRDWQCMNHNYVRKYYIMRNRLYIYKKYHKFNKKFFVKHYLKANVRLIFDIIFLEDDKVRKLKWAFIGIKDFLFGKMGKKNLA